MCATCAITYRALSSWLSVFGRSTVALLKLLKKNAEIFLLPARLEHCWFRWKIFYFRLTPTHKCYTRWCRRCSCVAYGERWKCERVRGRAKKQLCIALWTQCDAPSMSWQLHKMRSWTWLWKGEIAHTIKRAALAGGFHVFPSTFYYSYSRSHFVSFAPSIKTARFPFIGKHWKAFDMSSQVATLSPSRNENRRQISLESKHYPRLRIQTFTQLRHETFTCVLLPAPPLEEEKRRKINSHSQHQAFPCQIFQPVNCV